MTRQEYVQATDHTLFAEKLRKLVSEGGRVFSIGTTLESAEYHYTGGSQCRNINYVNVYWAVVELAG